MGSYDFYSLVYISKGWNNLMLFAFYTFKFDLDMAWTFQPPDPRLPVNPTRGTSWQVEYRFQSILCVVRKQCAKVESQD